MKLDGLNGKGEKMITEEDIKRAAELLRNAPVYTGPPMFFVGRSERFCQMAVEHWKGTNVIVVAYDGTKYQYGKKMEAT
jgi:hypothetical protein